jgi:uncharacterized membrane protein
VSTITKLSLAAFVLFVVLTILGVAFFPDAPFELRDGIVTGKTGHVHTTEEFDYFRLWQSTYFVVAGIVTVLFITGWIQHYRRTGSFRITAARSSRSPSPKT